MASKIKKPEWIMLYVVMGILDFVQFVIIELILVWLFGIGALINEILDPIVGALFALYLFIRGVSPVTYWKSYASILGMAVAEELTGGIAQLWILDVWYVSHNVRQVEGVVQTAKEQAEFMQSSIRQPFNQDGTRTPQSEINIGHIASAPSNQLNFNRVRRPG